MLEAIKISLKAARVNANLTLEQAAEKIGVSAVSVGNWERGTSTPSQVNFSKACEVYGFPTTCVFLPNG